MPRAPLYQPGQFDSPHVTGPEFRAADNGGGWHIAVAKGLQKLGAGLADYAQAEDAIQAHYDDTQSRRLLLEYQKRAAPIIADYSALKGEDAINAAAATSQSLEDLRREIMGQASNTRMSDFLDQRLSPVALDDVTKVSDFAIKAQVKLDEDVTLAELQRASENASANYLDPKAHGAYLAEARVAFDRLADITGMSAQQAENEWFKQRSGIHAATMDAMLSSPDGVDMAFGYFEANKDEMTAAHRNAALGAMKGPLQDRQALADFFSVASGASGAAEPAAEPGEVVARQTPAPGRVTSDFDAHTRRGSAGLDIAGNAGASIKPAADGEVIEVGRGRTGGNYIRIRHEDGFVTSYMHMASASPFKVGDRVTRSSVVGTVGSTGRATAPHLHFEVKNPQGRQVDPESYLNGSSPVGSPSDARNWDMASVMRSIDEKMVSGEWSPERAERARAMARKRMADDEALLADREQDALRAYNQWVAANPDASLSRVPKALLEGLSPASLAAHNNAVRSEKEASIKANGDLAITLTRLQYENPQRFLELVEQGGPALAVGVTRGEYASFVEKADKMRSEQGSWSPRSGIGEAFNYMTKIDNVKYNGRETAAIMVLMENYANALHRKNGGKELGPADYQQAYRYALRERNGTPRFEDKAFVEGTQRSNEVVRRFRLREGREPTDEEIRFLNREMAQE